MTSLEIKYQQQVRISDVIPKDDSLNNLEEIQAPKLMIPLCQTSKHAEQ